MKIFSPEARHQRAMLQVELAAFKARCEAAELMIQAERMQEDMNVKAERHLADSARWAEYERERLGIIEQHRNNSAIQKAGVESPFSIVKSGRSSANG